MSYTAFMKPKTFALLFPILLLSGCFNDRGISLRYYNDCEEYYDMQGYLHKKCDKNIVNYSEMYEAVKTPDDPKTGSVE